MNKGRENRDLILIKHQNDGNITVSRKRGHYFHRTCLDMWKQELLTHKDEDNYAGMICPLDRDNICKVYSVPSYEVIGFDMSSYNHDYIALLTDLKAPVPGRAPAVPDKLLDQISDIDGMDKNNRSLAYYACRYGNYTLVDKLLRRGADFNKGTGDHAFTPLRVAVCHNHYEIVKRLLSNKVVRKHCDVKDIHGRNAFSYCCEHSFVSIMTEFLNQELVTAAEVEYNLALYRPRYHVDRIFGYEIIDKMHHFLKGAHG